MFSSRSTQPAERLAMRTNERRSSLLPYTSFSSLLNLIGQKVALDTEHLSRNHSREAVDLASILLNLPANKQRLKPAGLDGQLEQLLPLVLVERRLLAGCARGVLSLALLLPRGDLLLFAAEGALPVLEVVLLRLVVLDRVEHQVAALLQERVDAEVQGVEVGREGVRADVGVARELGERGGEVEGGLCGWGLGDLVEEVGVVHSDGELEEDVLVSEFRLEDAVGCVSFLFLSSQRDYSFFE
jgi:hypothetical protein